MLKTEFAKPITLEMLMFLNEKYGVTVEIRAGNVTGLFFE